MSPIDEPYETFGLRIPQSIKREIERIAAVLSVRPSEVGRWIFNAGWRMKDEVIETKAKALFQILGKSSDDTQDEV